MKLRSVKFVAKMALSPSIRTIYDKTKVKPRLSFVHKKAGELVIDISDPVWHDYIRSYNKTRKKVDILNVADQIMSGSTKPKVQRPPPKAPTPPATPSVNPDDLVDPDGTPRSRKYMLECSKLEVAIAKGETENRLLELKMKKQEGMLVDTSLAEYLFFGFLEKLSTDLLRMSKKLAPMIDNFVKENDPDAILKAIDNEVSICLKETKKSQKRDLEAWAKENEGLKT